MAKAATVDDQQETPTLAEELDAARRAEQPLEHQVATLRQQLETAASEHDFTTALKAQRALPPALEAHAIAAARVASLQAAVDRVQATKTEADKIVQEARQRHQAEQDRAVWQDRLTEHTARCHEELAACSAGQDAIRASFAAAHGHGAAADEAREQVHRCLVLLGEASPQTVARTNPATAHLERDPVLSTIVRGSVL